MLQSRCLFVAALLAAWPGIVFAESTIAVDYPQDGSVFPPEFPAPTFLFRDAAPNATAWNVEVRFARGGRTIKLRANAEPYRVGEIDRRTVAESNEVPTPTPEQAASRMWVPDAQTWAAIRKSSVEGPATITFTGYADARLKQAVSRGQVAISTSKDPVGAPIFYRDVPLMPSETEKGIIKPLAQGAIPLIKWRLRDLSATSSRTLMEGVQTCANCHSFSRDGKYMGLDMDGPQNDKGLYAIVPVKQTTVIKDEDMVRWSDTRGRLGGQLRVGFMSQISPNGQYVVTTINDPGPPDRRRIADVAGNYFVANYKDYKFLQVFYATRGILAWYSKEKGVLTPLPGADDPKYVHANATWSPDGKYLIFGRTLAKEAYPPGWKQAARANDENETPIQYDLYRIPFNDGKGGVAEPVRGASGNGKSNSFPKISPDGRWLVWVQAKNGLLMRPDSELWIVPAEGGEPRRMRCNTKLMNSWHSWSPNGRWLVFSSKSRSPYTQMYLTHIDENGLDTPPILVENATAANRAVNLPEFVNVQPDQFAAIDPQASRFYGAFNAATTLQSQRKYDEAIPAWQKALELGPNDAKVHNNLAFALAETGRVEEAVALHRKAVELDPEYSEAWVNLGIALAGKGQLDEAIPAFETALRLSPEDAKAHANLAGALVEKGRFQDAIEHSQKALATDPKDPDAHNNLAIAFVNTNRLDEAIPHLEQALAGKPESNFIRFNLARVLAARGRFSEALPHMEKAAEGRDPTMADMLAAAYAHFGRFADATSTARRALALAQEQGNAPLADAIRSRLAAYEMRAR